jgi:hypothetical protein
MNSSELVVERARKLSEHQAELVLAYIDELVASPHLSASDLLRLPPAQRRAILHAQAEKAETVYRNDSTLICEDAEGPLPYA